jgi:DNA-binding transcriptional MocR family regulator
MLQYEDPKGSANLRTELSKFMARSGIKSLPESEILVLTGATQAFYLMSMLFIDPSDVVFIDSPTRASRRAFIPQ